jgi:hypothetical protein
VTQLGTGEAFRVEDAANPDTSPFVITADGAVGIGGIPFSGAKLRVDGRFQVFGAGNQITTTSASNVFNVNQAGTGSVMTVTNTATATGDVLRITNAGTGASFRVDDEASDTTPFIVDAGGNVGVKTASPSTDFEVNGNAKATTVTIGSSAALTGVATDAEAVAGTSSTLAVTPANLINNNLTEIVWNIGNSSGGQITTSGTGANAGQTGGVNKSTVGPTSVAGYANLRYTIGGHTPTKNWNSPFDFSRPMRFSVFHGKNILFGTDLNSEGWVTVGDGGTIVNNAGPNRACFGIKFVEQKAYGFVHDGTTLTVSSDFYEFITAGFITSLISSDGAGNVSFNIGGVSFTMTGGPTGLTTPYGNAISFKVINNTTLTGSTQSLFFSRCKLNIL